MYGSVPTCKVKLFCEYLELKISLEIPKSPSLILPLLSMNMFLRKDRIIKDYFEKVEEIFRKKILISLWFNITMNYFCWF